MSKINWEVLSFIVSLVSLLFGQGVLHDFGSKRKSDDSDHEKEKSIVNAPHGGAFSPRLAPVGFFA